MNELTPYEEAYNAEVMAAQKNAEARGRREAQNAADKKLAECAEAVMTYVETVKRKNTEIWKLQGLLRQAADALEPFNFEGAAELVAEIRAVLKPS